MNHKQGCEALGGYGSGVGKCTCGAMTDERRKRAEELYERHTDKILSRPFKDAAVDAMLAFAAEQVAKERARCAKVCREQAYHYYKAANLTAEARANKCAEAIERGEP